MIKDDSYSTAIRIRRRRPGVDARISAGRALYEGKAFKEPETLAPC